MKLIKQIEQKRLNARKDKDIILVNIIGLLISESQRKQRNLIEGITDDMVISSAKKLIESNLTSIDQLKDDKKKDVLLYEMSFLKTLLPTLISEGETSTLIEDIISKNEFNSIRDFGKIMSELGKFKNVDMKLASQIVKTKLAQK